MTETELRALSALAQRIVPPDQDGDPLNGIVAVPHVLWETALGGGASKFLPELQALLSRIDSSAPGNDFAALSPDDQDTLLSGYATDAAFRQLAELVTEGFYVSPEGMASVGFTPVTEVLS